MSGVHLHLLVNHAPIFGALFALGLLIASMFYAPDVLRRTAFVVMIGAALAGGVAYLTGDPAEDAIRGFPGVRRDLIHDHEEMAELALIAISILAVFSLWALIRWRREAIPRWVASTALAASFLVSGLMAYTGLLGGKIRHTEVRPGATPAEAAIVEPPRAARGSPPKSE